MDKQWYVTRDGSTKYGPYTDAQLKEIALAGRILPTDMVWQEGAEQWVPAATVDGLPVAQAAPPMPQLPPLPGQVSSGQVGNKIAAGVFGILLGSLGIHKFILGMTSAGLIMLLVSLLTCGVGAVPMAIVGLIEGIIYLTRSDEEFYRVYIVEKKAWF